MWAHNISLVDFLSTALAELFSGVGLALVKHLFIESTYRECVAMAALNLRPEYAPNTHLDSWEQLHAHLSHFGHYPIYSERRHGHTIDQKFAISRILVEPIFVGDNGQPCDLAVHVIVSASKLDLLLSEVKTKANIAN